MTHLRPRYVITMATLVCVVALSACTGAKKPGASAPGQVSAGVGAGPGATGGPSAPGSGGTATGTAGGTVPGAAGSAGGGTKGGSGSAGGPASGGAVTNSGGASSPSVGGGASPAGPTHSTLFTAKEDVTGISKSEIHLCAHAALTYGKAFNTDTSDLAVYFTALNKEHGGIFGRKITIDYQNDNYDPATAVQAAESCKSENPFMLLGGIGFDQIPSVRNWAEQNHMLYLYHTATQNGAAGKKYSYTELPSVEKTGEMFAEVAASKFPGKRIGIVERDSENWSPGVAAFKAEAKKYGVKVTVDDKVQANAANYTQQILDLKGHADVAWIWLNALEATEFIKQAHAQQYTVPFLLFPFNLTSQTLSNEALNPDLVGVAMYPAYSKGDYSGSFATYADDMKEFERQYATYDSKADLSGNGGDLLFLNWTAMKALARQLTDCGPNCTRNRFVDVLNSYHQVPTSSGCTIDFGRGDPYHLGGHALNVLETYKSPSGKVNWRNINTCVEHMPGIS